MWNFIKKIIYSILNWGKKDATEEERSPHTPDELIAVDLGFASHFKNNGGKFLYCRSFSEIETNFSHILAENEWFESQVLCFNERLLPLLDSCEMQSTQNLNARFFLTTCENLIADEGSILFSSNQIKEYKLNELPENIIVFATTSQLVRTKNDGLRRINNEHKPNFPSNITAISYFEDAAETTFLQYGSIKKNTYLLLLEDL